MQSFLGSKYDAYWLWRESEQERRENAVRFPGKERAARPLWRALRSIYPCVLFYIVSIADHNYCCTVWQWPCCSRQRVRGPNTRTVSHLIDIYCWAHDWLAGHCVLPAKESLTKRNSLPMTSTLWLPFIYLGSLLLGTPRSQDLPGRLTVTLDLT